MSTIVTDPHCVSPNTSINTWPSLLNAALTGADLCALCPCFICCIMTSNQWDLDTQKDNSAISAPGVTDLHC